MILYSVIDDHGPEAAELVRRFAAAPDRAAVQRRRSPGPGLLARALTRALLAATTGADGRSFALATAPGGKPVVADGPAVSWSHSGAWVAAAVAGAGLVGVDVECHRVRRRLGALAARAFGPDEQARTAAAGAPAFYYHWTVREAVAKATGEGLSLAADGRDWHLGPPRQGQWRQPLHGRTWAILHHCPATDVYLSLAATGPELPLRGIAAEALVQLGSSAS